MATTAPQDRGVVYGLHAFAAENQDEISFGPGEQVIVLEKDDQYGDGWWQGRNAAGDEGLFPVSYTSPTRPVLEDERAASPPRPSSPPRTSAPEIQLNSPPRSNDIALPPSNSETSVVSSSSTPMDETITEIQEAIEQLGVRGGLSSTSLANGSIRSFQSREDSHYDDSSIADGHSANGHGVGEVDGDETEHDEVGWSASTRKRLAEKAMSENRKREQRETEKELKRREREESEKQSWGAGGLPPGAEFSDESEDDDDQHLSPPQPGVDRLNAFTEESSSHALSDDTTTHAIPVPVVAPVSLDSTLEAGGIGQSPPNTASPIAQPSPSQVGIAATSEKLEEPSELAYVSNENLTAGQRATKALESAVSEPSAVSKEPSPYRTVIPDQVDENPLPSPALSDTRPRSITAPATVLAPPVSLGSPLTSTSTPPPALNGFSANANGNGTSTATATPPFITPTEQVVANPFNNARQANGGTESAKESPRAPSPTRSSSRPGSTSYGAGTGAAGVPGEPLEWGTDEVVEWAKKRGFGADVYEKFIEHEITGDVLLELDINLLKEIDITAFGKRHKLATAIADLRNQTHPGFGASQANGNGSIRSVATSLHPQSPTFYSPTGRDSVSNGIPSPGFNFAGHQQQQQSNFMARGGSMVGPGGETLGSTPEVGSYGEGNGNYGAVGLGLSDGTRTRESSYGAVIPPTLPQTNVPTMSRTSSHIRKPSGTESLVGTHIPEEPESRDLASPHSSSFAPSAPSSTKGFASKPEAASSRTDVGSIGSKGSSVPPSPASGGPVMSGSAAKRGSMGHKKSKQSVDENGKGAGSFFSRSGRKPAPRLSSNPTLNGDKMTSPDPSSAGMRASKSSSAASPTFRRASKVDGGGEARLRKRMSVAEPTGSPTLGSIPGGNNDAARALDRLPPPDFAGYLRKKGERYNSWKLRYCVLSGPHLYYLKSENDAKFKGYINMSGYKVIADENANPGYYGFRIIHDKEASHFFSLQEQGLVRDWMKALMKATISRDYSTAVVSSCNIPTMTLKEAQSMSPAPRPPSPSERAAMQAASRRENPNQLTARDASVLMGLSSNSSGNTRGSIPSSFSMPSTAAAVPPRPSREMRRPSGPIAPLSSPTKTIKSPILSSSTQPPILSPALSSTSSTTKKGSSSPAVGAANGSSSSNNPNIAWVNSKLPKDFPPVVSNPESFRSGLALVRLVEHITGLDSGIPLSDFQVTTKAQHEDVLYKVMDYFVDAGVDVDGLHVDDVVVGNPKGIDNIVQRIRDRAERG